jgi:hypothetical protein
MDPLFCSVLQRKQDKIDMPLVDSVVNVINVGTGKNFVIGKCCDVIDSCSTLIRHPAKSSCIS